MNEQQNKRGFRENFESHLNSPFTLLTNIRNLIFGTEKPDIYTQIAFFTALAGSLIFLIWSVLGTFAIKMRELIVDRKEIDVISLIEKRGSELRFEPGKFIEAIESFYFISIFLWLAAIVGLVLLWRKNFLFVWFFFSGSIGYIFLMWIILGFNYFRYDTTLFDKVTLFIVIGHTAIYAYFLSQEIKGVPVRLFGIDAEENSEL